MNIRTFPDTDTLTIELADRLSSSSEADQRHQRCRPAEVRRRHENWTINFEIDAGTHQPD